MTKCFKVDVKRAICDANGSSYNYSIWSDEKIIDLNLKSDEFNNFSVGDFIVLDDKKNLLKVIRKNRIKNKEGNKVNSVKLKK